MAKDQDSNRPPASSTSQNQGPKQRDQGQQQQRQEQNPGNPKEPGLTMDRFLAMMEAAVEKGNQLDSEEPPLTMPEIPPESTQSGDAPSMRGRRKR